MTLHITPLNLPGIGNERPLIIAGPCSAESEEQVMNTAAQLAAKGVRILRAGIWKPRTKPGGFEGVGAAGLPWLKRVKDELGMLTATEVATPKHVEAALEAGVDILWIGARTMANPFAVQELADSLKGKDREAVRKQITKGTEAIKSATGVETMLLRAPYAAFDEQNWIDAMDLVSAVVSWNIDSGDWLLNGADEQVSTVLESVTPGNIVLFTDSDECSEQTLEALPQIIDGLVAKGYKIVTLSDLVKTDTSLSKKLTSLTKTSMPKNAVFPQLAEDNDTAD